MILDVELTDSLGVAPCRRYGNFITQGRARRCRRDRQGKLILQSIISLLTNVLLQLADLITAVTLTDDGSYNTDQVNKLWSSRSEFQATKAPHLPLDINPVTIPEVERSISAVLHVQPDLSATHPSASIPVALSPLPSISSAPTPGSKPISAWVKKALDVITRVEEQSREVYATLVLSEDFDLGSATHVARMRMRLQRAAEHVDSAGQSLKVVRREELEVIDCKERAITLLKEIDARISFLGAILPPPPPETTPVFFDAGT